MLFRSDDDRENDDIFFSMVYDLTRNITIVPQVVEIRPEDVQEQLNQFLAPSKSVGKGGVSKRIKSMGLQWLKSVPIRGRKTRWFFQTEGEALTDQVIEQIVQSGNNAGAASYALAAAEENQSAEDEDSDFEEL